MKHVQETVARLRRQLNSDTAGQMNAQGVLTLIEEALRKDAAGK